MTLAEAVAALDKVPPVEGTWWGDAIIACREASRSTLVAEPVRKCRMCKKPMDQEGVICVACEDFVDPDGRSN